MDLQLPSQLSDADSNGAFKSIGEVGDHGVHRGGERSGHMASIEIHRFPVVVKKVLFSSPPTSPADLK